MLIFKAEAVSFDLVHNYEVHEKHLEREKEDHECCFKGNFFMVTGGNVHVTVYTCTPSLSKLSSTKIHMTEW